MLGSPTNIDYRTSWHSSNLSNLEELGSNATRCPFFQTSGGVLRGDSRFFGVAFCFCFVFVEFNTNSCPTKKVPFFFSWPLGVFFPVNLLLPFVCGRFLSSGARLPVCHGQGVDGPAGPSDSALCMVGVGKHVDHFCLLRFSG